MEFLAGWFYPSACCMLWKGRMDFCGQLVVSATNVVSLGVSHSLIFSLDFH